MDLAIAAPIMLMPLEGYAGSACLATRLLAAHCALEPTATFVVWQAAARLVLVAAAVVLRKTRLANVPLLLSLLLFVPLPEA